VDGNTALKVGQVESLLAVAAVGRAINWNSTSFSEIGSVWPLQIAQPDGGKLPANILISPTYGSGIFFFSSL